MSCKRIQITVDSELLDKVDVAASNRGLSRSSYFALACSKLIEAEEVSPMAKKNLADMFSLFSDVITGAKSKDEISSSLDDLQRRNDLIQSMIK